MYICPGHTVTQKKMGQFTQEHEYDVPQESTNGRQYDTINADHQNIIIIYKAWNSSDDVLFFFFHFDNRKLIRLKM
jgi:ribonucleotide reductase alpha subunit